MNSIFNTCVLFLVLPWKLTGEVTFMSKYTRQQEEASNHHETTIRGDEPPTSSPKTSENTLKTKSGKIQNSTRLHEGGYKHETTMCNHVHTISSLKNQDKYINQESKTLSFSKSPPQTTVNDVTSMSHRERLTHTMATPTEESRSSPQLFSLPFWTELMQKQTGQITTKPLELDISKKVTTNKDDPQTEHNFNSANKDVDISTQADKTTKSAEENSTPQIFTDNSIPFKSSPEGITKESGVEIETVRTLTTKWSSLPQEKKITHTPTLTITNGTLNSSDEDRNDTVTYTFNTLTTTGLSTGLGSAVDAITGTTNKTTIDHTSERNLPDPNSEKTPTTPKVNTNTPTPKSFNNKKIHPGPIVGSLIGTILILMLVASVVIWVKNHHQKKNLTNNPDWAGPSPFIEADMHPNLPTSKDSSSFRHQESKRISLYSFLPQRFSKRHSLLNSINEVVPLEDTQSGSTFGKCNTQPLNGKADQIQNHETNSLAPEVSSDSNAQENSNLQALENNENAQKTPDDIISSAHAEINTNPIPFEDVDLNLSLDKDIESTSSDVLNNPSPSPPVQS